MFFASTSVDAKTILKSFIFKYCCCLTLGATTGEIIQFDSSNISKLGPILMDIHVNF